MLGVPVCISAEVSPQIREYPRMITTACNAATMPVIGPYLDELQKWLASEGFGGSVLMMLSNGGVVSADDAARVPIRLVESGPAAGALAGSWFARRLGERRLLCFDMGGTTAKSCLIEDYEPDLTTTFEVARIYRFKKGSGFPVSVPSVDLVEIGAGGGSLARIDELGLLKVGPESAGADPGPACYGRGGAQPAVTDCRRAARPARPRLLPRRRHAARRRARRPTALGPVAAALGLPVADTAAGVHDVVNQNMAAAARMHGVEHGVDLRGVTVLAFGGAGPVHACGRGRAARVRSRGLPGERQRALGLRDARDAGAHRPGPVDGADAGRHRRRRARCAARRAARRGTARPRRRPECRPTRCASATALDARYTGQGNEITVWVGEGDVWPATAAEISERFDAEYERIYGLTIPDVGVRGGDVAAVGVRHQRPGRARRRARGGRRGRPPWHRARCASRGPGPREDVPVYRRDALGPGARFDGPAIVEERETTSVIRPGWSVEVAPDGVVGGDHAGQGPR